MRCRKGPEVTVSPLAAAVWGAFALLTSPAVLGAVLAAAALHELGHYAALRLCGGRLRSLRLTPLGALMVPEDTSRLSYGAELAVTLAGPAVNGAMTLLLGLLGRLWPAAYVFAGAQAVLGAFNLLPARGLDGGRALWLAAAWCTEPFTADRVARAVGLATALAVFAAGAALCLYTRGSPFLLLGGAGMVISWAREKGLVKPAATG